jgi:hypothetical protein
MESGGRRKVAEDESQLPSEVLAHGVDDRMREAAMRTLVVAVFDQSNRRVGRMFGIASLGSDAFPSDSMQFEQVRVRRADLP